MSDLLTRDKHNGFERYHGPITPELMNEVWGHVFAHWEDICAKAEDHTLQEGNLGVRGCALCAVFFDGNELTKAHCEDCPIRKITGERHCDHTPFEDLCRELEEVTYSEPKEPVNWGYILDTAKWELEFLRDVHDRTMPPMEGGQDVG